MGRKPETISFIKKRLPHWEVVNGLYFITICHKDAIPKKAVEEIKYTASTLKSLKGGELLEKRRSLFRSMEN